MNPALRNKVRIGIVETGPVFEVRRRTYFKGHLIADQPVAHKLSRAEAETMKEMLENGIEVEVGDGD